MTASILQALLPLQHCRTGFALANAMHQMDIMLRRFVFSGASPLPMPGQFCRHHHRAVPFIFLAQTHFFNGFLFGWRPHSGKLNNPSLDRRSRPKEEYFLLLYPLLKMLVN
jgi:hypothetical protein